MSACLFQFIEEQRALPCNWTQRHPGGRSNSPTQQQSSEQQPVSTLHRAQSTHPAQRSAPVWIWKSWKFMRMYLHFEQETCCVIWLCCVFPGSKKLAPVPPKVPYGQSGGMSDQSTGQPSPVSLSPTPPSTPSPYGLVCPPGQVPPSSPGQTPLGAPHSLSSPPSLTGTLTKSRPTPKPRQRPSLPPPQPPTAPPGFIGSAMAPVPQPLEQGLLDGLSPGESMSTGKQQPLVTTPPPPPPPPQVGLQRPSLRLAVALSNGDGGRV